MLHMKLLMLRSLTGSAPLSACGGWFGTSPPLTLLNIAEQRPPNQFAAAASCCFVIESTRSAAPRSQSMATSLAGRKARVNFLI